MTPTEDSEPAFPEYQKYVGLDEYTYFAPQGGMTKREEFAKAAMQGMWSNPVLVEAMAKAADGNYEKVFSDVGKMAREQSDQLITALNRGSK